MGEIEKIDKYVSSISKGGDKKNDAMMLMAPDSNWDQFLTPAPCAIALLGDLILISADTDFSLAEKPPRDGFKLLKYPNSFRASLVQVSNAGWRAFNEAHSNMNQICLHSGNVDGHVKHAVKFLIKGSTNDVERMVPLSLKKIQNIADESLQLAQSIEDRFIDVMELTGELLEACTNTKGIHEEKVKQTERAIEVAKTEKMFKLKEIERTEKTLKKMEIQVKEAQTDFKEAIKSVPTGGELIAVAVCEALIDGVRNITSIHSKIKDTVKGKLGIPSAILEHKRDEEYYDIELSCQHVYAQVSTITKYIDQLATISSSKTGKNAQPLPDMERIVQGDVDQIQQFIEMCRKHVNNERDSGTLRKRVLTICDDAVDVCTSLKRLCKSIVDVENKNVVISEAITKAKYLQNESQKLDVEASKALGRNPLDNKSPHLLGMPTESGSSSAVQAATENARYKTELAKETLKDAKRRQEKAADELQDSNEKLTNILKEMAKLDLTKVNFDTIRETLVKGITALAEVREQWGKLVRFFQKLSGLIKCCLHTSLTDFVDQAKMARESKMESHDAPLSNIYRDVIFEQALKASQIAHVVRTISGAYVQISDEHLMDRITCLGSLVALDPKRDEDEIRKQRAELHNGCEEAQRAILSIIMREKEEFNAKIEERIKNIKDIERAFPTIEPERLKEIKTNVASGMAAFTDEDIDELV